jgi:metallo-beta-lactamase family protein
MPGLEYLTTSEQSKVLNNAKGPMVIIAASGMCEGGRILHHLQNGVTDPRNILLITGYQAESTLGRRIVNLESPLKIFGESFDLQARVHTINALSAHADRAGLSHWIDEIKDNVRHAFAVHGEPEKVTAMTELLREKGIAGAVAPQPGQTFKID